MRSIKQWVLKCSGCFTTTRELGRSFCAKASLRQVSDCSTHDVFPFYISYDNHPSFTHTHDVFPLYIFI
jgi:hypothetical protein